MNPVRCSRRRLRARGRPRTATRKDRFMRAGLFDRQVDFHVRSVFREDSHFCRVRYSKPVFACLRRILRRARLFRVEAHAGTTLLPERFFVPSRRAKACRRSGRDHSLPESFLPVGFLPGSEAGSASASAPAPASTDSPAEAFSPAGEASLRISRMRRISSSCIGTMY